MLHSCNKCFFCKHKLTFSVDHATILKSSKRKRLAITAVGNAAEFSMFRENILRKK